jgi:uncharacterized membrane protein
MLAISGLRRGVSGLPRLFAGAAIVQRGLTGHCEAYRMLGMRTAPSQAAMPYELGVRARASITINGPRNQIFTFWRKLDSLPLFMEHLEDVEISEDGRSHWIAKGPAGAKLKWTAEIINEVPDELIAWKSLAGGSVDSAGSVRFKDAPGGRGTEVHVELQYNPPAGFVGAYVAKLFGKDPERQISADLRRLKQYLETGDIVTTEGQPKGPVPDPRLPRQRPRQEPRALLTGAGA